MNKLESFFVGMIGKSNTLFAYVPFEMIELDMPHHARSVFVNGKWYGLSKLRTGGRVNYRSKKIVFHNILGTSIPDIEKILKNTKWSYATAKVNNRAK